jgi:hypothetical protein
MILWTSKSSVGRGDRPRPLYVKKSSISKVLKFDEPCMIVARIRSTKYAVRTLIQIDESVLITIVQSLIPREFKKSIQINWPIDKFSLAQRGKSGIEKFICSIQFPETYSYQTSQLKRPHSADVPGSI